MVGVLVVDLRGVIGLRYRLDEERHVRLMLLVRS